MGLNVRDSRLAVAALSALALGLSVSAASTAATTINFDDIANANGGAIAPGYGGLTWNNVDVLDTAAFEAANGPSGYSNGVVSSPNVALNGHGQAAYFSSNAAFTLNDLYLTAAWMDGMDVQISGLLGATLVDSVTERIDTSGPTHAVLNWVGIDKVEFVSSGGVLHGYTDRTGTAGDQFALDNVTLNAPIVASPTPELGTWGMLTLGLGLVGAALRSHRGRRLFSPGLRAAG